MGTRSSIKFYSNDTDHPLVNIFQMFDGYIDGVGYDLAQWLCSKIMINGIGERTSQEYCNGAGCLVAQFIKDKKVGVGDLYIDTMNRTCDYNYKVIINDCIPFDVDEVPVNNLTKRTILLASLLIYPIVKNTAPNASILNKNHNIADFLGLKVLCSGSSLLNLFNLAFSLTIIPWSIKPNSEPIK